MTIRALCGGTAIALLGPAAAIGAAGRDGPARDPASVNLCEEVPGGDVARALGKALKTARPFSSKESRLGRCTYVLAAANAPEGPTEGYTLWLYGPGEYEALARVTEGPVEKVAGFGDEAILFHDPGDGRYKLRAVRRGRFTVEATTPDAESARKLAQLGLERLSR